MATIAAMFDPAVALAVSRAPIDKNIGRSGNIRARRIATVPRVDVLDSRCWHSHAIIYTPKGEPYRTSAWSWQ